MDGTDQLMEISTPKAEEREELIEVIERQIWHFSVGCLNCLIKRRDDYTTKVAEIRSLVQELFPEIHTSIVQEYGSVMTGLLIPSSDLDILVTFADAPLEPNPLSKLETAFQSFSWIKKMLLIESTTIPVIKIETIEPSIKIDVTIFAPNHRGLTTTLLSMELLKQFSPLRALTLITKQLLAEHQLNNPYSGGMTGYGVLLMVTSFLQYENHLQVSTSDKNAAVLFLKLLKYFGTEFAPHEKGIAVGAGQMFRLEQPTTCAVHIQDPIDHNNNVAKSCFNFASIQHVFKEAYRILKDQEHQEVPAGLSEILPSVKELLESPEIHTITMDTTGSTIPVLIVPDQSSGEIPACNRKSRYNKQNNYQGSRKTNNRYKDEVLMGSPPDS